MQSRMDKYNNFGTSSSRTAKNQELYQNVKTSALENFDVNSNMQVIEDNASNISVSDVRRYLDEKYNENNPKRKSIEIPIYEEDDTPEELIDTKEYDINAILAKAKKGKDIDYKKQRLKKVRDAQFEILNNLDLEIKKIDANNNRKKEAEDNLINLINTITELELKNRESANADTDSALDLLSDLQDDKNDDENTEEMTQEMEEENEKTENIEDEKEEELEKTLNKLEVKKMNYEDFSDISKHDFGSMVLKIIIFLLVILLVIGGIYILNNVLNLELF